MQESPDKLCMETNNQVDIKVIVIAGDVEQELKALCIYIKKKHGLPYKSHSNDFIFNANIPTMVSHPYDVIKDLVLHMHYQHC